MRYPRFSVLIFLIAPILIISCTKKSPENFEIGVILPLTGDVAVYGKSLQNGLELALASLNSRPEIEVKYHLAYEDSKADPKDALTAYQKLHATKGIFTIIGPFTSSEVLAVAPQADKDKVIILSPGASAPNVTTAGDYTFRIVTSDLYDGKVMADFAYSSLKFHNIAILYINNEYGIGVYKAFREQLLRLGGTLGLEQTFDKGAVDFRSQLIKVKQANPDAIFVVGYKEMGRILKQIEELKIEARILSIGLFEDPEIIKIAGKAAEGVYYSLTSYTPDSERPEIRNFTVKFREKYGNDPDIIAGLGYDALNILVKAIEQSNRTAESVKTALYQIKGFPGVTGETSFDGNGDVNKPFGIKRVMNGEFVWHIKEYKTTN